MNAMLNSFSRKEGIDQVGATRVVSFLSLSFPSFVFSLSDLLTDTLLRGHEAI